MADKTGIEWTDATWNPVTGCEKVSQGCKNCYAERDWSRLKHLPAYTGRAFTDVAIHSDRLDQPARWTRPRRIFVNSMSDLFHESVPFEFIAAVFGIMGGASHHAYQVLTKRPARMLAFFAWVDAHPDRRDFDCSALYDKFPGDDWRPFMLAQLAAEMIPSGLEGEHRINIRGRWPLQNVCIGVSVEDQATADERIPALLQTPAAVRWISAEPLLGPVSILPYVGGKTIKCDCGFRHDAGGLTCRIACEDACVICKQPPAILPSLDWIVVGGESGRGARAMHPDWVSDIRVQCDIAHIPFFFKQWGEWAPCDRFPSRQDDYEHARQFVRFDGTRHGHDDNEQYCASDATMIRIGKKGAGRALDGRTYDGYPEVMR